MYLTADCPASIQSVRIRMAHVDVGTGNPIVFLHGTQRRVMTRELIFLRTLNDVQDIRRFSD
jgi:hypothetical protein